MTGRGTIRPDDNYHKPVMVTEVLSVLEPKSGKVFLDVTLGGGGHAEAILEISKPDGVLVGVDRDTEALKFAGKRLSRFKSRTVLLQGKMGDAANCAREAGYEKFDGIIADLGVSSWQLNEASRGFSFMNDGPLDMRMDATKGESAAEVIAGMSESQLADIIWKLGEDRFAKKIAAAIVRNRGIGTTAELAKVVTSALPPGARHGRIHPATRTFQAIRIFLNDEMGELDRFLESAPRLLSKGGKLCVISYHSLEDRKVKHSFKNMARDDEDFEMMKKFKLPSNDEIRKNPRARSAKLRALFRME